MRVWCDGALLADPTAPALRLDDHGFTVGDGVFETLKVTDGVPFALTRHLARLTEGARRLGLPEPDLDAVRRGIGAVLDGASGPGRLRVTFTAGPGPFGSQRGEHAPTLVVALAPATPQPGSAVVVRVPWVRNERSAVAGVKTVSFAENVVALARAREVGAGEALLANTAGNVCEGTGSNVGYVVDGQARTPSLASGCLPGVTRALLLEWADVVEVDEPMEVLEEASEVFLLSSTRDVQPVRRLDGRDLPAPGPVTAALQQVWARNVAERGTDP
ncbi:MAG: aminotransferase class IV [Nocardioidaceae bacterium]|nr:aminotransferase class IV [Nocardioidaceae bacterium]